MFRDFFSIRKKLFFLLFSIFITLTYFMLMILSNRKVGKLIFFHPFFSSLLINPKASVYFSHWSSLSVQINLLSLISFFWFHEKKVFLIFFSFIFGSTKIDLWRLRRLKWLNQINNGSIIFENFHSNLRGFFSSIYFHRDVCGRKFLISTHNQHING